MDELNVLSAVVELRPNWEQLIDRSNEDARPVPFTLVDATRATMQFMDGVLTESACHAWADFIRANPLIKLDQAHSEELREFLEDWSSGAHIPIEPNTVEVWQSRFAIAETG